MNDINKEIDLRLKFWQESLTENDLKEFQSYLNADELHRSQEVELKKQWELLHSWQPEQPTKNLEMQFNKWLLEEIRRNEQQVPEQLINWQLLKEKIFAGWRPQLMWGIGLVLIGFLFGRFSVGVNGTKTNEVAALQHEVERLNKLSTLSLLQHHSASERLAAIENTRTLTDPNSEIVDALLQTIITDPSVNVQIAAAERIYPISLESADVRSEIRKVLPTVKEPMVQAVLIESLARTREQESVTLLEDMLPQTQEKTLRDYILESINKMEK